MNTKEFIKEEFKKINENIEQVKMVNGSLLGGVHEKFWVQIKDKHYLFKYNLNDRDYSDFGEVFTSYLSYLLGYNCVSAYFGNNIMDEKRGEADPRHGVLVESYITDKVKETISFESLIKKYKRRHFSTSGYTVREAMEILTEFCADNKIALSKHVEQDLKEMALMDFLLLQVDRHTKNIEFLIVEKDGQKVLKVAPMFDNAFCLYLNNSSVTNEGILTTLKRSKKACPIGYCYENPMPIFYIESSEKPNEHCEHVIRDLATELINNRKLMNLYKGFLKVNLKEELNYINSIYKRPLPQVTLEAMQLGVKNRIKILNRELAKQMAQEEDNESVK